MTVGRGKKISPSHRQDPKGAKYILTCVDIASRKIDGALKTKTAKEVLSAFKAIHKRNHLSPPTARLEVDDGNEFKGEVKDYFVKKLKIHVREIGRASCRERV